jgi:Amt family ammonium transporter
MDFAGGTAVHITSGTTVAAISTFYTFETRGLHHCLQGVRHTVEELVNSILFCCKSSRKDNNSSRQVDEHEMSNEEREQNGGPVATGMHIHEIDADLQATSSELEDDSPHNVTNVVLGTALLWIGWYGFNGGSALGGNLRAVSAITSTHIAACSGASANLLIFWLLNRLEQKTSNDRKLSIMMFCDGAVIALVAITPAAGYVRLDRNLIA